MDSRSLISNLFNNAAPFIVDLRKQDSVGKTLEKTFFGGMTNPIGIEVEIEGVQGTAPLIIKYAKEINVWSWTEDQSLKDHGIEFVSHPIAGKGIDLALNQLEAWFKQHAHRFSHRCSIHIHQNCSDLTVQDLNRLFSYYVILEGALFGFCHPLREMSAFCVPLTYTNPRVHTLEHLSEHNKYLAFNMFPLQRQHTVEYRHLEGTDDMRKIRRWIQILCKLHRYVTTTDTTIFRGDLDKFAVGDTTPLQKMLGVHFHILNLGDIHKSVRTGYEWLAVRGIF